MELINLKEYCSNPRTLTQKQHDLLKRDLLELGDLSGIVHDLNSGEIIGGNQRVKIFCEIPDPKIIITEKYDAPTKAGTVALGYVEVGGEKFSYREVRWTKKQCKKANIVANRAGGEWDFNILANAFEVENLLDWGFEDWELGKGESPVELQEDNSESKSECPERECPKCGFKWKANEV